MSDINRDIYRYIDLIVDGRELASVPCVEINNTVFVNCTRDTLFFPGNKISGAVKMRPSGPDEIIKSQNVIIPPSGIITRLIEKETNSKRWLGQAISLRHIGFTCIDGLPEKHVNVIYVVSRIVAQHLGDRTDVFCPGDLIRDGQGNIIGCKGLAHF